MAQAATHYVSHSGSNTFPYLSWATATDSIPLAFAASNPGDTVRVADGAYTCDSLLIKQGMAFLGEGAGSTYIQHTGGTATLIRLADGCSVRGFHFDGIVDTSGNGNLSYRLLTAVSAGADVEATIEDNEFSNLRCGIDVLFADLTAAPKKVQIVSNHFWGFYVATRHWSSSAVIRDNVLFVTNSSIGAPILHSGGRRAEVIGNVLIRSSEFEFSLIDVAAVDSVNICNNVCVTGQGSFTSNIFINRLQGGWPTVGMLRNNLLIGSNAGIIVADGSNLQIANNIIVGSRHYDLFYDETSTTPGNVGFNLFWQNANLFNQVDTAERIAAGCLFALPMFVDSSDYHLQAYSPAIDAGDTLLLDLDGTRSDLGPYGGPLGASYAYLDLPPTAPSDLSGIAGSGSITVNWVGGFEADFARFAFYRDTVSFAAPAGARLVTDTVQTASYTDSVAADSSTYYYRVLALDTQGLASGLSEELVVSATGIRQDNVLPLTCELMPNSPNPFNSGTMLRYRIAAGNSKLMQRTTIRVYDLLGRWVSTILDQPMGPGEHQLTWNGTDAVGLRVSSGVYFVSLQVSGQTQYRKVLLLR